jgi:hypothetical protein
MIHVEIEIDFEVGGADAKALRPIRKGSDCPWE